MHIYKLSFLIQNSFVFYLFAKWSTDPLLLFWLIFKFNWYFKVSFHITKIGKLSNLDWYQILVVLFCLPMFLLIIYYLRYSILKIHLHPSHFFYRADIIKIMNFSASFPNPALSTELASLYECPVCYEYISPPLLQCSNGHMVSINFPSHKYTWNIINIMNYCRCALVAFQNWIAAPRAKLR